ncbi:hypothetical protein HER14_16255 [Acidithiobacillus thiooxidans]|uniref:hypothetical protein n=1 Tax=Acidithiobacillus thiooxidans TaxID=930 RepID=UPI001C0658E2|nr:hypothetical protein [Acidithiobacillus thiooxidans]MBU2752436.1 hypothetical protein [Acidithiobacillus thiooxidans]
MNRNHEQQLLIEPLSEGHPMLNPHPVRSACARSATRNMASYLIDLGPFFSEPKQFLEDLRASDFAPKGYDCSAQVAIRLMRWSQSIQLTPRQNHVMNQIISEAIRRGATIIESKIRTAEWSIPDHRDDHHDLAVTAATKALQHFTEKHDLTTMPHPNMAIFVDVHTRFASRDAMEDFIYRKRLNAEFVLPHEPTFSKASLERAIRQRRSELKHLSGEKRQKKVRELERLEATLHGARTEVRLEYALEERGDHEARGSSERLSLEDQESIAVGGIDLEEEDDSYEMPANQREFLDLLIQVGRQQIAARQLIPYLVEAREYRAILGLLRVLKKTDEISLEAGSLRELLGNRNLADIRKKVLRVGRADSREVVSLFESCKTYLRGENDECKVLAALQVASV